MNEFFDIYFVGLKQSVISPIKKILFTHLYFDRYW